MEGRNDFAASAEDICGDGISLMVKSLRAVVVEA
jgi:hypothetical protein